MIFLELFLTFFMIGAVTFGGGYAMLPLIQEAVLKKGWIEPTQLVDFVAVAKGLGYRRAVSVDTFEALDKALAEAVSAAELTLIEVKTAIGSRVNLGRPTIPPCENKRAFMTNFG